MANQIFNDLRAIHASEGLAQAKFEKRGCRLIADRFFSRGTPAFASVAYPEKARVNPQRADECDLVIAVNAGEWLWIEKKVIWKPGAAHYIAIEAVNDARKLDTLARPEASYVGLLMIGLDATKRPAARLTTDVNGRYVNAAKIGSWRRHHCELDPAEGYRIDVWFWWRSVDDLPS